jgi:beta-barrel assembly-enhancing protease
VGKSVGVIVSVQGTARFFSSGCMGVILCAVWVALLGLPAISAAQLPNSTPIQDPRTSEGQQLATPTAEQVPASTPSQPDATAPPEAASTTAKSATTVASQMPTAGRVEAADVEASADHDTPAASVASPPAVPNTPSAVPHQGGPTSAKYDVSQIGRRSVGSGLDFYSLDREIALGRQLSNEVEQSARLLTDPIINEYINRIGQNLVRNSDARVPFTIKILDTDDVNAFALPGGFFYVNSGLILAADDEAELAGVMAHEIAHVAARHATKNMTRAQIWNLASVPLIFIGGPIGYAISEVASIAVPMTYLKFSRDAEREADLLGLEYDYATGYDPHAFVEFFEKLNVDGKKKHSVLAKAFATHPMNADRIKAAQDEIRKYLPDRPEYVVDTSEFENVKSRLIALESGHRLNGTKGYRPVLLKRTNTSSGSNDSGGASTQDDRSTTDQNDDDRPTLKRNPPASN